MKSFFASVECVERGLDPMTTKLVVADEKRTDKTICLAVSPALKKMGIKNRCRLFEIPKDIDFIIAPPQMKKYIEYSANIYGIYLKYIDKSDIHVYSIDECFLDVTSYLELYNIRAKDFAMKLIKEIESETGIPASVGIGTNLYLAKIALDITAKTTSDRIGFLNEEKYRLTLSHHKPLLDFWQISHGTVERLSKFGVSDMAGIRQINEDFLYKEFGINAELLIDHAWGRESCTMKDIKNYKTKSKSISSSYILPENKNFEEAKVVLSELVENGTLELAKEHLVTSLIHIYIGFGDNPQNRESLKWTIKMSSITNLYSIIGKIVSKTFDEKVPHNRLIRKLGYDFDELLPEEDENYDFFTNLNLVKKEKNLVKSVVEIKNKYGKNSILKGIDYTKKGLIKERNATIGGHRSGEEEK